MSKTETIQAFPNPASDNNISLKIQLSTAKNVQVRITDMSAKVVYKAATDKLLAGSNLLNLNDAGTFSKGTYIIELISGAGKNILLKAVR